MTPAEIADWLRVTQETRVLLQAAITSARQMSSLAFNRHQLTQANKLILALVQTEGMADKIAVEASKAAERAAEDAWPDPPEGSR